jgi:predicted ATPase
VIRNSIVCPILVGRQGDLGRMMALVESAAGGAGQTVVVTGEAGVGKSRLLAEAARVAAEHGFTQLQGQCFEPDQSWPYVPVLDLLHGWMANRADSELAPAIGDSAPDLRHRMPELARFAADAAADAEPDKRRLFEALARSFTRLATRAPLLIVFEDLHWADDLSLEFLLRLARRLRPHRLLLALSYRADEAGPALARLIAELGRLRLADEVALGRLSREQVELMIRVIFN